MNIPHNFIAGTKAKAGEVNENFSACKTAIEDNGATINDVNEDLQSFKATIEPQVMPDYNNTLKEYNFITSVNKNKITLKAGTIIRLEVAEDDIRYLQVDEDTEYNIFELLDSGISSLVAGKDYYIYIVQKDQENEETSEITKTVELKISANSTFPTGYNSTNSRKIGGFHTLCVAVTEANAPVLVDTKICATHPAIGYNAGDLIPNSVWCLSHRPLSEPEGMVYIDKIDLWVDIYLQGGKDGAATSIYGATVIDNRQEINHRWDFALVNKRPATDYEFIVFAEGSNQKTNIYGSAAPNPKIAGGHLDTAGKRMISIYFVEECCGYLWQWLDEIAPVGASGWASYGDGDKRGQTYGMPYCLLAGGAWSNGASCGSRSRNATFGRSIVNAHHGGRGVSRPLRAA